ncbi:hypothetical protein B484DRAFT_447688 [Ochromonadaceae sp. CCMP2298]|nr:hypothetical protein B484DRAFT_447688 [Ochromonadaceae sp. CCMP2298]
MDLYFDEAVEGEEEETDELEGSVSRDLSGNAAPMGFKDKKSLKACRHFAYRLICNAVEMGWGEIEVANLIKITANQLDLTEQKLIHLLDKTSTGSPSTIAHLLEDSSYAFTDAQIVSAILSNASSVEHFITLVGEAFECGLFAAKDEETIDVLYSFSHDTLDDGELISYAREICEHSETKRNCGYAVRKFTSNFSDAEAASCAHDIVMHDFFPDLEGSLSDFLETMGNIRPLLELTLAGERLTEGGEIEESDADSQGNLRDFVVGEDEEEEDGNSNIDDSSDSSSSSSSREDHRKSGSSARRKVAGSHGGEEIQSSEACQPILRKGGKAGKSGGTVMKETGMKDIGGKGVGKSSKGGSASNERASSFQSSEESIKVETAPRKRRKIILDDDDDSDGGSGNDEVVQQQLASALRKTSATSPKRGAKAEKVKKQKSEKW